MTTGDDKQQVKQGKTRKQREKQRRRNLRQRRNRIINLYLEVDGKCIYCGKDMWCKQLEEHGRRGDMATMEHIIPLAKGGAAKRRENQTCSCYECNGMRRSLPHLWFKFIVKIGLKKCVEPCRQLKVKYWNVYVRRLRRVYKRIIKL